MVSEGPSKGAFRQKYYRRPEVHVRQHLQVSREGCRQCDRGYGKARQEHRHVAASTAVSDGEERSQLGLVDRKVRRERTFQTTVLIKVLLSGDQVLLRGHGLHRGHHRRRANAVSRGDLSNVSKAPGRAKCNHYLRVFLAKIVGESRQQVANLQGDINVLKSGHRRRPSTGPSPCQSHPDCENEFPLMSGLVGYLAQAEKGFTLQHKASGKSTTCDNFS